MASLGSSGTANSRSQTLRFLAEIDRNSLRKTQRGFADLRKNVDQFARAEIESARVSLQLTRSNAEQKTGVTRLSNEFDELRLEMLQASDAAEKLDRSLDQTARQRKVAGIAGGRGGGSLRADIGGIGDIETASRAVGGGLGAAGFRQAEVGIAIASEIPASIEAIGQLKQALGKDLKLAFDALKGAIGGAGLGLIGATVALVGAYTLASRATAKATQALAQELEARNEFDRIVRTQTSDQIRERLQEIAIEEEIAEAQRKRAADALNAARAETEAQGTLLEGAIRLADALNISDSQLDALKIEFERTSEIVGTLTTEQENLTRALTSQVVAARDLAAQFGEIGPAFKAELKALVEEGFFGSELTADIARIGQNIARGGGGGGEDPALVARLQAALAEDIRLRSEEQTAISAAAKHIEALRTQRERETEAVLQAQRKRDFNRRNQQAREAEAAKEAEKNFNILTRATEKFSKLQEDIARIQTATSEKLAAIRDRLNEQRIEAQRKFAEDLATAQRAFAERRLKIQETFQDAMERIQRQFSRSTLQAIGERDALSAHNAAVAAKDQQQDTTRQRDRSLREQARAEVERNRILRQSLDRQLRTQLQAAARQIRTAIQSAQRQIAIRQQQMQVEAAIMAQFAASGVRSVQQFVAGALGALSALSAGGGTRPSNTKKINQQIDSRIEKTINRPTSRSF